MTQRHATYACLSLQNEEKELII